MASQSWGQLIAKSDTAGTLYNTFTTQKSLITSTGVEGNSAALCTLPPNFWQRGSLMTLDVLFAHSWASGNTMIFSIMMGAISACVSATHKVTTTGGTTEPLFMHVDIECRAIGNGTLANLMSGGYLIGRGIAPAGSTAGANYAAGMGSASWREATPAVGTGFDSTVANTVDLQCTMGTSSASNGIQIQTYRLVSWGNSAV